MNRIISYVKSHDLYTFFKFAVTGVANTLINFIVFTLLSVLMNLNIYFSEITAYACGMLNSYIVNRTWTFTTKEKFISSQLIKFVITNLVVLGLSLVLLNIFTEHMMMHKLIAKVFATVITTVVNFLISKLWVYRN